MKDIISKVKEAHQENVNFLAVLEKSMIAVNDTYVYELGTIVLKGNEEIAVIPPISGGWAFY